MEILQKSKEEALMTADAFRIAFEQQLMRKNDQALRQTRVDKCRRAATWTNRQHLKEDGYPAQRRKKTLGQRLLGILPSENSSKRAEDQDNLKEVLKMLRDLVSTFACFCQGLWSYSKPCLPLRAPSPWGPTLHHLPANPFLFHVDRLCEGFRFHI